MTRSRGERSGSYVSNYVSCKVKSRYFLDNRTLLLEEIDDPRQQSFASDMSVEEPGSQDGEPIASSSQEIADFKKPPLPHQSWCKKRTIG